MKSSEPQLEPELLALLAPGKIERRAPPDVRARALANARAIIAAKGRVPRATVLQFPVPRMARRRAPIWVPLTAAVVAVVAVAAAASVAFHRPTPQTPQPLTVASSTVALAVPSAVAHDEGQDVARIDPLPPAAQPRAANPTSKPRIVSDRLPSSAELDLLSRAQVAYTRGEFPRALSLIAEHARRFPNGHLAEEREALRIRSLAHAGHPEDSRRAAAAFSQRFPRSALLTHAEGADISK